MFRNFGYIMLYALLILSTIGFAISRHYCNDKLMSISVNLPNESCCDDFESECCHDEKMMVVLKVDLTQPVASETPISEIDLFSNTPSEPVSAYSNLNINYGQSNSKSILLPHALRRRQNL